MFPFPPFVFALPVLMLRWSVYPHVGNQHSANSVSAETYACDYVKYEGY